MRNSAMTMPKISVVLTVFPLVFLSCAGWRPPGQSVVDPDGQPANQMIYKQIDTVALALRLYYPSDMASEEARAAIVFFFGGGWRGGTMEQFAPHARHYAERGMVGVLADYRVESRHGTTPFEAVRDAKSAIRYLRAHADSLGIDPQRIVAAGGSAGGHLAAAAGTLDGLEEPGEDLSVSSRPDALVLFNPVFDNGPQGYGFERVGGMASYRQISPLHNIDDTAPPTVVFLGTRDHLVPVATAVDYCRRMTEAGVYCELHLYGGQEHGFFNARSPEYYRKTVAAADPFLEALGFFD